MRRLFAYAGRVHRPLLQAIDTDMTLAQGNCTGLKFTTRTVPRPCQHAFG